MYKVSLCDWPFRDLIISFDILHQVILLYMLTRELCDMCIFGRQYLTSIENWVGFQHRILAFNSQ